MNTLLDAFKFKFFLIISMVVLFQGIKATANDATNSAAQAATAVAGAADNGELVAGSGPSSIGLGKDFNCANFEPVLAAGNAFKPFLPQATALKSDCLKLVESDATCTKIFENTRKWCHTEENANIATSVTQIQSLMTVASGVTNACNNFGKAMGLAKTAMAAYTTACGAAQVACNMKCGTAAKNLTELSAKIKVSHSSLTQCFSRVAVLQGNPGTAAEAASLAAACIGAETALLDIEKSIATEIAAAGPSITNKVKVCQVSVASLLGTAVINLGTIAQSKVQSDQCKADTAAAKAAKEAAEKACTNPANKDREDCKPKDLTVDCGKSENTDKPICICKANPRMAGCDGVSTALATNSTLNSSNGSGLGKNKTDGRVLASADLAAEAGAFPGSKNGNGSDGRGTGGGSASSAGLGDSGGGSSGDPKSTAADGSGSGDSSNVLDGSDSGGGFRARGMGGYTSPDYRSKLKAFGLKNGIGAKISGSGWTEQVTSTGGKSNFDKVKARYQENKTTLLGGR